MATKLSISKSEKTKQGGPVDHLLFFPQPVIGVDEVGRGCLAGAVYAAAVILDDTQDLSSLADSKTLSASRRESLSNDILKQHQVAIGIASVQEIEELNILQASLLAMKRAVEKLKVTSGHVLVDGTFKIPGLSSAFEQTTLIQGDSRAKPIAAASIVAKVARDSEMQKLALQYPEYFFEKHKGYSTALHKNQIKKLGPCPLHRKTFAGVKEYVISENQKR